MYIHYTTIYRNTDYVYGIDKVANDVNKVDYETNYKSLVQNADAITPGETAVTKEDSYTAFKGYIDGVVIKWSDVITVTTSSDYVLTVLTENDL